MKPKYTNDRNAPRMKKSQFATNIITNDLWRAFKKKFPEYKEFSNTDLNRLWNQMAEIMRHEVVNNPLGLKLGSYSGELKLQYLPHKFQAEDMVGSQQLGEEVKHLNILTRSKVAKVKWERRWAVKFNKMLQFYAFDSVRDTLQQAKDYINANPEKLRVSRNTLGGQSFWRNLEK